MATSDLLTSSTFDLIRLITPYLRSEASNNKRMQSVGAQFAKQLQQLRQRIDATSPHYIRCLKPNDMLIADHFHPLNIVEQLRYGGVLEAVRVSRAGYPTRYSHEVFLQRYYILGRMGKQKEKKQGLVPGLSFLINSYSLQDELEALVKEITLQVWKAEHQLQTDDEDTAPASPETNNSGGWLSRNKSNSNSSKSKQTPSTSLTLAGVPIPTNQIPPNRLS